MNKIRVLSILIFVFVFVGLKIGVAESAWGSWRRAMQERFQERKSGGDSQEAVYIMSQGIRRYMYVHVPASYRQGTPTPLILNFHGGGGGPKGNQKITQMNEASDRFGFIVAYPAGTRADGDTNPARQIQRFWNYPSGPTGVYNTNEHVAAADDLEFTKHILEYMRSKYTIDEKRIYACGLSNGGILTQYVGWALSDQIAAIATVAGPLWQGSDQITLKSPISVMYFQGTADKCAPMDGGHCECEKGLVGGGRTMPSTEASLSVWREKLNCPSESRVTYQKGEVTCYTWGPCDEGSEVVLCKIEGGGHTWPGGAPYSIPGLPIGKTTQDINANNAMWLFFQRHPKK